MTYLLIGNGEFGKLSCDLERTCSDAPTRHGKVVVGEATQQLVYGAIQTELNARRQLQAVI